MKLLKRLVPDAPSAEEIAAIQLDEAKRQLLTHQSKFEYHGQMVTYYERAIKRLSAYVAENVNEKAQ